MRKNIEGEQAHIGTMDITVRRNAYGKQIDSFSEEVVIPEVSDKPFPLVFIRAPWIDSVGDNVKILCKLNGHIVAAREKQYACNFVPPPNLQKILIFTNIS